MKKLETREEAKARAFELFPIHEEFDVDRLKELREAYLQGWEEAQQDKQTCGFCVEPATELTDKKSSESLDTKEDEGSELPSEKQKELLKEMMRKDEACGMYDDLSDVIDVDKWLEDWKIKNNTDLAVYSSYHIDAIEAYAKYYATTLQDNGLREAAEKVVYEWHNSIGEECIDAAMVELVKVLNSKKQ